MSEEICKICKRTNLETKLTYNIIQEDFLCTDCYRKQFSSTTKQTIPIFF